MLKMSNDLCSICNTRDNPNKLVACDGTCDTSYHIYCLNPPLESIPNYVWLCQTCKFKSSNTNDITFIIGEVIAAKSMSNKDWSIYLTQPQYLTFNLSRGSLWKQNYYVNEESTIVTRFLVKWANFSYLHLSWELEEDLLVHIGPAADSCIDKFLKLISFKEITTGFLSSSSSSSSSLSLPSSSSSSSLLSCCCYPYLRLHELYPREFSKIDKIFEFLSGDEALNHYRAQAVAGVHGTNCSLGAYHHFFFVTAARDV